MQRSKKLLSFVVALIFFTQTFYASGIPNIPGQTDSYVNTQKNTAVETEKVSPVVEESSDTPEPTKQAVSTPIPTGTAVTASVPVSTAVNGEKEGKDKVEDKDKEKEKEVNLKAKKPGAKKSVIVKYKNLEQAQSIKKKFLSKKEGRKLQVKYTSKKMRMEALEVSDDSDLESLIAELKEDSNVEYVQQDFPLEAFLVPQDPRFNEQWGLSNSGQTVGGQAGILGMDIDAVHAWDATTGEEQVLVAVVDTGVDVNHEDLKENIFANIKETSNGLDDDGNGYIDDIQGWDFANNDNSVYDSSTQDLHGTHVAGIIAGRANSKGISGVAPNVKILPLKFINGSQGYTSDAVRAVEYASSMGASIINCSWGGSGYNPALKEAMEKSGALFVCAAGNSGTDVTSNPVYPASFDLSNVMSIAAMDNKGMLAPFSNYGGNTHIAAPGANILSTLPGNQYGILSGTSMAAPFASGVAALVKSRDEALDSNGIKTRIMNTSVKAFNLTGKVVSSGRLHALNAVLNKLPSEDNEIPKDEAEEAKVKGVSPVFNPSLEGNHKTQKPLVNTDNLFIDGLIKSEAVKVQSSGNGIENLSVNKLKQKFITFTWTTSIKTSSTVYYGNTDKLGKSYKADALTDKHQVTLRLDDGEDINFYRIESISDKGTIFKSEVRSVKEDMNDLGGNAPQGLTAGTGNGTAASSQDVSTLSYIMDNGANHTFETAQAIPAGTVFGTMVQGQGSDFYAVNFEAGKTYSINLKGMAPGEDYDLNIYNSARTSVSRSSNVMNYDENVSYTCQTAGTYYIVVEPYYVRTTSAHHDYQLMVFPNDLAPDSDEPNDSVGTAKQLAEDTARYPTLNINTDEDWYFIDTAKTGKLSVTMKSIPQGCDYDIQVYKDGSMIGGSYVGSNGDEKVALLISSPGKYYIRVYSYSGSHASDTYALKAGVYTPDSYEVNDNLYEVASRGTPSISMEGSISATIDNREDVDGFKFVLDKDTNVGIRLKNIPAGCDYDLMLYSANMTELGESSNGSNTDETIIRQLTAGTYFVKVYSYSAYSETQSYQLSVNDENLAKVKMELDKTTAAVGEVITATVKVENVSNFAGYQANIKYDPQVVQPVDDNLMPYASTTKPGNGNILLNYSPISTAAHGLQNGILNFGKSYSALADYRLSGTPESSGILAVVKFKVLKNNRIDIRFEENSTMPQSISGVYVFDWNGNRIKIGYMVQQPPAANEGLPVNTQSVNISSDMLVQNFVPLSGTGNVSGYISPDVSSSNPDIKKDFKVSVLGNGMVYSAMTDANGYFTIPNIPSAEGYTIEITKDNYLKRIINNVTLRSGIALGSASAPVSVWAGDMLINGEADNAVNMEDIMEVIKYFNTSAGQSGYVAGADLNKDGAVNMSDIVILIGHFNVTPDYYPVVEIQSVLPTEVWVSEIRSDKFTVHWTPFSGAAGYKVYVDGILKSSLEGVTEYTVQGLQSGNIYKVTVQAVDALGNPINDAAPVYGVYSKTLAQNTVCDGNLFLEGTLDLNGHILSVAGSVFHLAGEMRINNGTLHIQGDYKIEAFGGRACNSDLIMTKPNDRLIVEGSFLTDSTRDQSSCLTDGIMEIRGNFTQRSSVNNNDNAEEKNFSASGKHRVIFNGDRKQTISFEDKESRFNNLEIANSSTFEVDIKTPIWIFGGLAATDRTVTNSKNITLWENAKIDGGNWKWDLGIIGYSSETNSRWVLQQDQVIEGNLYGTWGALHLNGYRLKIGKDLILSRTNMSPQYIDISSGVLEVGGNLLQRGWGITLNKGSLTVAGDYRIEGDGGGNSKGGFAMTQAEDRVTVMGNFVTDSEIDHRNYLKAGIVEIKGDFTQRSSSYGTPQGEVNMIYNFAPSEACKVILSGEKVQMVSFEDPLNSPDPTKRGSGFNILCLTKPIETGYVFLPDQNWKKLIEAYNKYKFFDNSGTYSPTGNYSENYTDMVVDAPGLDVVFGRFYNSQSISMENMLGKGWSFSFEGSVDDTDNAITVIVPGLGGPKFKKDSTLAPLDSRNKLELVGGIYKLTTKDQTVYTFNTNKKLSKISDRNGNTLTISYNSDGSISGIDDAAKRHYFINYASDSQGKTITITDPKNRTVRYEIKDNKLVKATDPTGKNTIYEYDTQDLLKTVKNHQGKVLMTIHYTKIDDKYLVLDTTDALGKKTTYSYDKQNMNTTVIESKADTSNSTDQSRKTVEFYDGSYHIVKRIDAANRQTRIDYYDYSSDGQLLNTTINNESDKLKIHNKYGEEKEFVDSNGNKTIFERDSRGNITKKINPDGSFKTFTYDSENNLIKEVDEEKKWVYYVYEYDSSHVMKKLKKVQPFKDELLPADSDYNPGAADANDRTKYAITVYEYYAPSLVNGIGGLLWKETDPNGHTKIYTYDAWGNIKTMEDAEQNKTEYQNNTIGWKESETSPRGYHADYWYDNNGRLLRTELRESGITTRTVYDIEGRTVQEISPVQYDPAKDQLNTNTAPVGQYLDATVGYRYKYDYPYQVDTSKSGMSKTVTDPENNGTKYEYDLFGNLKSETNHVGAIYEYDYDDINRPIKLYFRENSTGERVLLEEYSYQVLVDKFIGTTMLMKTSKTVIKYLNSVDTATTVYTYDYAGRLIELKKPDATVVKNIYNSNGTLSESIDEKGYRTFYRYNSLNRVIAKRVPVEEGKDKDGNPIINYSYSETIYDPAGNKVEERVSGEMAEGTDEKPSENSFIKTRYEYYSNNSLKNIKDKNGFIRKHYEYDGDGNLSKEVTYAKASAEAKSLSDEENYIKAGVCNVVWYENDQMGKPIQKSVSVLKGDIYSETNNNFEDNTIIKLVTDYTYDGLGNIESVKTPNGVITRYTYDNMGRLICSSQDGTNPNVTVASSTTYNWGGKPYTVTDAKGNTTKYEYDKRGFNSKVFKGITVIGQIDDGFTNTGISWQNSYLTAYRGSGALISSTPNDTVAWTPDIPETGDYNVYVWYANSSDNTTNAKYSITYNGGIASVTVDQTKTGGHWKILGTYRFLKGKNGSVKLTVASGKTIADSVMFEPVEPKAAIDYYYDLAGRKIVETSPKFFTNGMPEDLLSNYTSYSYDNMDRIKTKSIAGNEMRMDPVTKTWKPQFIKRIVKNYEYDDYGNMVLEQDALGYKNGYGTKYAYNIAGKLKTVLDPESKLRGLEYSVKYEYDALGRKVGEIEPRNSGTYMYEKQTLYTLDDDGNVKVIRRNTDTNDFIERVNYDFLGNITDSTDGNRNTTYYEYNGLGKVRRVTHPWDSTIPQYIQCYQYDAVGNLKLDWGQNQQGAIGTQHLYTYDNQGRQTSIKESKSGFLEEIETSVQYDKNGNKVYEKDGNGNISTNQYDVLNRLVSTSITTRDVDGNNPVEHKTTTTYDKNGNVLQMTDWRGNFTENIYDDFDRLIQKNDQNGKAVQYIEYNENSAQEKSYDALGNATSYMYDRNGRLTKTQDPEVYIDVTNSPRNHVTAQEYDSAGNVSKKTDGMGNSTEYRYDAFDRLQEVINNVNGTVQKTFYIYDNNGNMTSQEDHRGVKTTIKYNAANKVKEKFSKGGEGIPARTESYIYYEDGNLRTKTDKSGKTTSYTYDCHGRVLTEVTGSITKSYAYDNNDNELRVTETVVKDGKTTTKVIDRKYDELNRVVRKTVSEDGNASLTTTYKYDIIVESPFKGTAELATDSKNNSTIKAYDAVGRLSIIANDSSINTNNKTTYEYDQRGNRQSVTYPDGSKEVYSYYKDNLLQTLINYKKTSNGLLLMDQYDYKYDAAHNQVEKREVINGASERTTVYGYDEVNRLKTVTEPSGNGSKVTSYTYDNSGNRSTETIADVDKPQVVNSYGYNDQNRIVSVTSTADGVTTDVTYFNYDNNGNQTSVYKSVYTNGVSGPLTVITTNVYDELNRLTSSTAGDKTAVYTYNPDDLRDSKLFDSRITKYYYDYDKVVLEEESFGTEKKLIHNTYGTNLLSRTITDISANPNPANNLTMYYMYNGHGDVTALIDTNGVLRATYYYDAFGNPVDSGTKYYDANGNLTASAVNNPFGYAGYQYDKETGLYYLNARMY
ncbi:MAG: S8 family serine peptidase, partial [Clostridia bacterium]|nr:S8 family serine peptidase [Clostridia bacterium]